MNFGIEPILFKNDKLFLIDQRILPHVENYVEVNCLQEGHEAIESMVTRGAPCIGFTAIYTLALTIKSYSKFNIEQFRRDCDFLNTARPTAVNLKFEIEKCFNYVEQLALESDEISFIYNKLVNLGDEELKLSQERNLQMAKYAEVELTSISNGPYNLQTHCNTGSLACGSIGTALGVISYLNSVNKIKHVYVDETRPYLQGSRLSSFELLKEKVSHDVVVDGACSYLMREGLVDAIFVGADRIVLNGDTANKVGTSTLAIVAKHYGVPFYVVAPLSSFDPSTQTGKDIEIEMRPQSEVTHVKNIAISHEDATSLNPSFDVTTSDLITGIICEKGVLSYPYKDKIKGMYDN